MVAEKTARRLHEDNRNIQVWMKPLADLGDPQAANRQERRAKLATAIRGFIRENEAQGRVSMFVEAPSTCAFMYMDRGEEEEDGGSGGVPSLEHSKPEAEVFKKAGYYYLKILLKWVFFNKPARAEEDGVVGKLKFQLTQVSVGTPSDAPVNSHMSPGNILLQAIMLEWADTASDAQQASRLSPMAHALCYGAAPPTMLMPPPPPVQHEDSSTSRKKRRQRESGAGAFYPFVSERITHIYYLHQFQVPPAVRRSSGGSSRWRSWLHSLRRTCTICSAVTH